MAIQDITLGVVLGSYFSLQTFANLSTPESNPSIQYYYHSFDPFGRGYYFHNAETLQHSNWVKGALGYRYDPKLFLDEKLYFDNKRFLGFVWSNRVEIGGGLNESQKLAFPSWIKWAPEVVESHDPTILKDAAGTEIGRMKYDEKRRLIPRFRPGLVLEPLYRPANFNGFGFDQEVRVSGIALDSEQYTVHMISPVASEESSGSSISCGEIIVPSPKL